ncbi:MAG TPA: nucleotide exchange factor GrpE [Corynebacteriales bacterium]|nr:nucleotide exchange factor GrpE [Mycobacteriales bacterium]
MTDWIQLLGSGVGGAGIAAIANLLIKKSERKASSWEGYQALNADLWETISELKDEVKGLRARITVLEDDIEEWKDKYQRALDHIREWVRWFDAGAEGDPPEKFRECP